MNRRAVLAGLLAIALAAVAVALVRSGSGGNEVEAMRGKPFTGDRGLSRTVASIKARQRHLDAHPEIERRRSQELAAEEAAREAANEEAAREGKASGERTAQAQAEGN